MYHFCTITTYSHLYKVYALADSLENIRYDFELNVLVIDSNAELNFKNCNFLKLADVSSQPAAADIIRKYYLNKDKLRWSLKPVLMKYLLQTRSDELIYLDNDLFFFNDYTFLFSLLKDHSFILTPHYIKTIQTKIKTGWRLILELVYIMRVLSELKKQR